MKRLSKSQFLQVSIMLFGLFFGAGNLMFPPLLGNQAGSVSWLALLAFSVTAVIFPVLGAIVVGKTEGLSNLGNRVGTKFSILFTTAIYLSIGPGLGIPRAGSVPFEMAIAPYLGGNFPEPLARFLYTLVFFGLALWICLNPSKLVKRVGKYLTPLLLVMLALMFVRVMTMPARVLGPVGDYQENPLVQGFLAGYETMDAVAALNFGFVIALAIRQFGLEDKKAQTAYSVKAGLLAGLLLFLVYAMLTAIGTVTSGFYPGVENGVLVLSQTMKMAFGNFGLVFLAGVFTLACLTTCVGLITSGSEYFHRLFKEKLSYQTWVFIWTGFSLLMANVGLNNLLAFSVPLLTMIYPVALVLIVMGASHDILGYSRPAYLAGAFVSVVLPFVHLLKDVFDLNIPLLTQLESSLPLADKGLSWVLPTFLVLIGTSLVERGLDGSGHWVQAKEEA